MGHPQRRDGCARGEGACDDAEPARAGPRCDRARATRDRTRRDAGGSEQPRRGGCPIASRCPQAPPRGRPTAPTRSSPSRRQSPPASSRCWWCGAATTCEWPPTSIPASASRSPLTQGTGSPSRTPTTREPAPAGHPRSRATRRPPPHAGRPSAAATRGDGARGGRVCIPGAPGAEGRAAAAAAARSVCGPCAPGGPGVHGARRDHHPARGAVGDGRRRGRHPPLPRRDRSPQHGARPTAEHARPRRGPDGGTGRRASGDEGAAGARAAPRRARRWHEAPRRGPAVDPAIVRRATADDATVAVQRRGIFAALGRTGFLPMAPPTPGVHAETRATGNLYGPTTGDALGYAGRGLLGTGWGGGGHGADAVGLGRIRTRGHGDDVGTAQGLGRRRGLWVRRRGTARGARPSARWASEAPAGRRCAASRWRTSARGVRCAPGRGEGAPRPGGDPSGGDAQPRAGSSLL